MDTTPPDRPCYGSGARYGAPPTHPSLRGRAREDRAFAGEGGSVNPEIKKFNARQGEEDRALCETLAAVIDENLPEAESKIWHGHPVWFLEGNPIVGYSKLKDCVRLLFWSGQSFEEPGLAAQGSFKAAEARYTAVDQIDREALEGWLEKSRSIQWDYKNIVKRKGRLERLL